METLADRVILSSGLQRWLLTIVSGAALALTLAPFDFPAVGFISFTLLVWLFDGIAAERTGTGAMVGFFCRGFLFFFSYSLASTWWLAADFLQADPEVAWAFPLALLLYPALTATFYALGTAIAGIFWTDGIGRIAALAFALAAADWIRAAVLPGLAFNPLALTIMPAPIFMQAVGVAGVAGMTALAVFVFSAPATLGTRTHAFGTIGLATAILVAQTGFGAFMLSDSEEATEGPAARIVQASAPKDKNVINTDYNLNVLLQATKQVEEPNGSPDLFLWPGTSLPLVLSREPVILEKIASSVNNDQVLVAGTFREESGESPLVYKSAAVVNANGEIVGASDKRNLTPIREFEIFPEWLRKKAEENDADRRISFTSGGARQILPLPKNTSALSFFDTEIHEFGRLAKETADVDLVIHLSDNGGNSAKFGIYQELRSAQIAAALSRLPGGCAPAALGCLQQ